MDGNILDTNVIIRILNGDNALAKQVSSLDDIHIPLIVLGELIYGAEKSAHNERNIKKALDFCAKFPMVEIDSNVALEYGKIKAALEKDGKTISENDIWIAAMAMANDMTVLSQDHHFSYIAGLSFTRM